MIDLGFYRNGFISAQQNRTERNGTERNGTERNGTERNETEWNGTERKRTKQKRPRKFICLFSKKLNAIKTIPLSTILVACIILLKYYSKLFQNFIDFKL